MWLTLRGAADDAGSAFITDRDNVIDKGDCSRTNQCEGSAASGQLPRVTAESTI